MPLAKGTINPLNVLRQRKLNFIPKHFTIFKIDLSQTNDIEKIDQWIYNNLNSRYCVKRKHIIDEDRKIVETCEVGIEDGREMTMFLLACPNLNNNRS